LSIKEMEEMRSFFQCMGDGNYKPKEKGASSAAKNQKLVVGRGEKCSWKRKRVINNRRQTKGNNNNNL